MAALTSEKVNEGDDDAEPLDDSPEGQLLRFIRGYVARIEHQKLIERTWRGKMARAAAGRLMAGSKPSFGYVWAHPGPKEKSRYAVNRREARLVRLMFAWALRGDSLRGIAQRLTRKGIPSPKGLAIWHPETASGAC